jgi:hypothetical protein
MYSFQNKRLEKRTKMYENVRKCTKMYENVRKCTKMYENVLPPKNLETSFTGKLRFLC